MEMTPCHRRNDWAIIGGSPHSYLNALRDGRNESATYPPERTPYPYGKMAFDSFVAHNGGRAPHLFARIRDGLAELPSGLSQQLGEFLRNLPCGKYFCKPDHGKKGNGALRLEISALGVKVDGEAADLSETEFRLSQHPYLVQSSLVPLQHPQAAQFNPDVINTIRLVTFDSDRGPAITGGIMRLANSAPAADNWALGALAVPIDIENGVLADTGVLRHGFTTATVHPRSGLSVGGMAIPYFHEACELVCTLHARLAIKTVGWDIALLKDGPVVLEGNRTWDVYVMPRLDPGFFASFMDYHLYEPVASTLRFALDGDFADRDQVRLWLSHLAGHSLVRGRVDHMSGCRLVVTLAGSQRGMDAAAQRLRHEAATFRVEKIRAGFSTASFPPIFDIEASFAEAALP
jgi:hypothetical protein